jgi:1A family penicillin-binding protein
MRREIDRIAARLSDVVIPYVRGHQRAFVATIVVLVALTWSAAGASAWFVREIVTGLPENEVLRGVGTMAQSTTLIDVKGRTAFTIFQEQRIDVPLDKVSPNLVRAIIAVEDQRFYDHGGVDVVRIFGAALNNVKVGRAAQGGSTLTQQLARQSFLTPDKTIRRKLKEVVVAARLEKAFTKDQILNLYLNKVYFGDGLYGAEAASLGYFGKHAAELDLPEAALLAGLVKSPSTYAPTVDLDRATARRNVVLQLMRESGAIDQAAYADARNAKVHLNDILRREDAYGQYFKEEVRKQLVQRFGWDRVYQGGLKVYTTIDLDMQKAAEAEVARALDEIEKRQARRRGKPAAPGAEPLQAALVAMDPLTGDVRALVGGRDFVQSHFNRATQAKRQPGSAFKPFVYAAALEQGYSPASLITGLNDPIATVQGAWVPEDEHLSSPSITMRTALRTSSNRAAVRMLQEVGIPETVSYAEKLGVGSLPSVPSLALGSGEVTLVSMTAAYAAFANGGMLPTPSLITRVETARGEVLMDEHQPPRRAVSEATAFLMTSMMADVINAGTAWTARREGFTLPAAGKTGTTNDYHDAWFVGFTPTLVTGVWVGYDQPKTIIGNGYAAELAVPLWGRFMKTATSSDEPEWFRAPGTVGTATICRLSGKLATDACRDAVVVDNDGTISQRSMVYTEYFARGTEPEEECPIHGFRHGEPVTLATTGVSPEPSPVAPVPSPAAASAPQSSAPQAPPPGAREPESQKKRGFWSRLFGRDGDKKDEKRERR